MRLLAGAAALCTLPAMAADLRTSAWWVLPLLAVAAGVVATVWIAVSDADRGLASWVGAWNQARGGKEQDRWWWLLPYHLPGVLLALMALGAALAWRDGARREAIYIVLVVAVGSGLIANLLLKDCWGRPRPRDTDGFGGVAAFHQPWQPGGDGRSFPSGHVTVPAVGIAIWLLLRRRRPRLGGAALAVGIVLCVWIGAARVLSGAHWLSDLVWAVVVMTVVAAVLQRALISGDAGRDAAATAPGP